MDKIQLREISFIVNRSKNMSKYDYLKKYINSAPSEPHRNFFGQVRAEEIQTVENSLKFQFPMSLKNFWLEIGYGSLTTSNNKIKTINNNTILYPEQIADILLLGDENPWMLPEYVALMEEGDIPFFEIGDSSDFMFMKRFADNKEAIYDPMGRIVADNFEQFIWRLYYDSPTFYIDDLKNKDGQPVKN